MFASILLTKLIRRPGGQQSEAPPLRAPRTLPPSLWRRIAGRVSWPLVAIMAVQAGLSLSLVWSNTVFGDEANYLWQGHLEWAHWLHGYPIPVLHASGASAIYPPLGALADSVGGLAGARILSLCFMLGATVLLYLTASSLFGRRAAIIGSALWALSEPVLRLAFATYDPMACFLVALSAWLVLQAGVRRRGALMGISAASLGLASATAFSFAIMIPAVVAFAFFAWAQSMGLRRALWYAAGLLAGTIATIVVIFTGLHLWTDLFYSTVDRGYAEPAGLGQGIVAIAGSVWAWDGLMLVLAAIGVAAALAGERQWSRKLLLLTLLGAGLIVPVYQAHIGTDVSMDKHMSAGTWFLAMAAGYGIARMTATVRWKPFTATSIAVVFLAFPAITGLWYARTVFHSWPNTSILVSRIEPLLTATNRPVLAASGLGFLRTLQYATPQGYDWARWVNAYSPPRGISSGVFGLVVVPLNSTLNSPKLPRMAVTGDTRALSTEILSLATNSSGKFALVKDVEQSGHYRLQEVMPFTTNHIDTRSGFFAVWTRIGQRKQA
jgi:hypothetical protein